MESYVYVKCPTREAFKAILYITGRKLQGVRDHVWNWERDHSAIVTERLAFVEGPLQLQTRRKNLHMNVLAPSNSHVPDTRHEGGTPMFSGIQKYGFFYVRPTHLVKVNE
jgi:hypothetical protein